MSDITSKIRAFLARFFKNLEIKDDDDIFALGFVNSLFAMQLVLFIEKEFAITIENEELDISNFRTIETMARLVERKTSSPTNA